METCGIKIVPAPNSLNSFFTPPFCYFYKICTWLFEPPDLEDSVLSPTLGLEDAEDGELEQINIFFCNKQKFFQRLKLIYNF